MTQKHYQSPPVGHQIIAMVYGVPDEVLKDNDRLSAILSQALKKDNFTVVGEVRKDFDPQGFTDAKLLSESHALQHTYPEYNSLYLDLYSCLGEKHGRKSFEEFLSLVPHDSHLIIFEGPVPAKEGVRAVRIPENIRSGDLRRSRKLRAVS